MLLADTPVSVLPELASILESGLPTLLYFGERDLSCNFMGGQAFLADLPWRGRDGWNAAPRNAWRAAPEAAATGTTGAASPSPFGSVDSGETAAEATVAGFSKAYLNLNFLLVWNSGHLVPFSAPAAARDMFARFVHGRRFADVRLPVGHGFSNPAIDPILPSGLAQVVPSGSVASPHAAPRADVEETVGLPLWTLVILSFVAGVGVATPLAMHFATLRANRASRLNGNMGLPGQLGAAPAAATAGGVYGSIGESAASPLNPLAAAGGGGTELTQRRREVLSAS